MNQHHVPGGPRPSAARYRFRETGPPRLPVKTGQRRKTAKWIVRELVCLIAFVLLTMLSGLWLMKRPWPSEQSTQTSLPDGQNPPA